jgi:LysM repeat protein
MREQAAAISRCSACGASIDAREAECWICGAAVHRTALPPPRKTASDQRRLPAPEDRPYPYIEDENSSTALMVIPQRASQRPDIKPPVAASPAATARNVRLMRIGIGFAGAGLLLVTLGALSTYFIDRNASTAAAAPQPSPNATLVIVAPAATSAPIATIEPSATVAPATATSIPAATATRDVIAPSSTIPPPTQPPAVTASPTAVVEAGVSDQIYIVQRGDTCARIASAFGVSTADLLRINRLDASCPLQPQQQLIVPSGASRTPTARAPTATRTRAATATPDMSVATPTNTGDAGRTYVVGAGDNCLEIARSFGVTVDNLIRENSLDAQCRLSVNQVLRIPTP